MTKDLSNLTKAFRRASGLMGKRLLLDRGCGTVVGVTVAGGPDDGITVRLDNGGVVSLTFAYLASVSMGGIPTGQAVQVQTPVPTMPAQPEHPPQPQHSPEEVKQIEDAQAVLEKLGMKKPEAREAIARALQTDCKIVTQELVTWVYRHR